MSSLFALGGAGEAIERMEQFSPNLCPSLHLAGGTFVFILKPRLLISVGVRCWNMLFQKLSSGCFECGCMSNIEH